MSQGMDSLSQHPLLAFVIVLGTLVLLPMLQTWLKDRRERKADEASHEYLKSIAGSNQRLADGQASLNALLQTSVAVNTERHVQNIEAMKHVCKCGTCTNWRPGAGSQPEAGPKQ